MNQFFADMWDVLRLRVRPLDSYRYSKAVYLVILLVLGLSTAAVMQSGFDAEPAYPLKFTNHAALLGFALCLGVVQWWSLSHLLSKLLHYFGGRQVVLYGYMLLTQAFAMFGVVFVYLPSEWMLLATIWHLWTFWIQLYGLFFIAAPEISAWRVLLAYVLSYIVFSLVMILVGSILLMSGQIDDSVLQQEMQRILQQQQQSASQPQP